MSELPQIPRNYTWRVASTVQIGTQIFLPPTAIRVDTDLHCWVDPFAKQASATTQPDGARIFDGTCLLLERVEGGFKLDLTAEIPIRNPPQQRIRPFEIGGKPEPIQGVEWIPVVEIVAPPLPSTPPPTPTS